jgi:4'-phosphopantetheinyl transferase
VIDWWICDHVPEAEGWLSASEQAALAQLTLPKRRRDWLLGRWTAKQLVRAHLGARGPRTPELDSISIDAGEDGAPVVRCGDGGTEWPAISLSISHSNGVALSALSSVPDVVVGADIERVEPRDQAFVRDFFTPAEAAAFQPLADGVRDRLVTASWCVKEASLKVLKVGLRADTRTVECVPRATEDGWSAVSVRGPRALSAWWRPHGQFAVALARG